MHTRFLRACVTVALAGFAAVWLLSCTPQTLVESTATSGPVIHYPLPTTLSSTLPSDLVPPGGDSSPPDFYNFAWQEFIALNWPALAGQRGVPDPNATIGDVGTVVWETYKTSDEVFLPNGATPSTQWNDQPASAACPNNPSNLKVLSQVSKFSDEALSGTVQAAGYTLFDRYNAVVYYEMLMNRDEFEYIVDPANAFYNKNNTQAAAKAGTISFPMGVYDDPNHVGAIEIKASWRILDPQRDAGILYRYHSVQALVIDPGTKQCTQQLVGLVGLHIIHKTTSKPVWVWATFEQVDNTNPPQGGPESSFVPPIGSPANPSQGGAERPSTPPDIQVHPIAQQVNPIMQQLLGTVTDSPWPYYKLIGTQWILAPAPADTSPPFLGNVTMETNNIVTQTLGSNTFLASSCIDCHGAGQAPFYTSGAQASGYDFSFILQFQPQAPQ